MADKDLAEQVYDASLNKRRLVRALASPNGLVAVPLFPEFRLGTVEHLLDINLTPEEIIDRMAAPEQWKCGFHTGRTPEEAIKKAERKQRPQQSNPAVKSTPTPTPPGQKKLPALAGSIPQIAWANSIRSAHAAKNPDSRHLKDQKRASWWIENRNSL